MRAFYNDTDPFCCAWISNLMDAGLITPGKIDDRSICDIAPDDIAGFERVHFFAGIAGWDYALRLAGWPDDRPVWTGSCPCQPYSAAGKRKGDADARNLWPEFRRLIAECRPPIVFGEQVASKDGRLWLAGVRADLEALAYAVGAADLCSAGCGAPNIRQRLYWVAEPAGEQLDGCRDARRGRRELADGSGLGDTGSARLEGCDAGTLGRQRATVERDGAAGGLEYAASDGWQQRRPEPSERGAESRCGSGFWSAFDLIPCTDGKARRVESAAQRLVDGLPGSLGCVRADIIAEIEAEIVAHGVKTGAHPAEVVRDLWRAVHEAAKSMRSVGEHADVREAAVLLAVLCQLAEQGWTLAQGLPREGTEASRRFLRMLWHDEAATCASRRRGLAEQRPEQSANPVHLLATLHFPYRSPNGSFGGAP